MSGIYLHGLVIKDGKDVISIVVETNIFSHSELRSKWLLTEQPHANAFEWSWDYVTKEFVETKFDIAKIAQGWIDKNLSTYEQLRKWIDKNWIGLTCDLTEHRRMWHIWGLLDNPNSEDVLIDRFLKAYQEREKADQEWKKAYQEWKKADQEWKKAYQEWKKAYQEWKKAYQEWKMADQERKKAYQEWEKAYQEWKMADQERKKAYQEWEKAEIDWRCRIMKPVFLSLLDKYPAANWKDLKQKRGERECQDQKRIKN